MMDGKAAGAFCALDREKQLTEMVRGKLDVLIIGGGITGAGIALDAASRGMKAGLVEMQDFAAGTSSRSTKLVHGGLRYLKQLELGVVAEVGKERAIVYENGPHVTTPIPMLLPLYKGGTFGRLSTSVGLLVYDYLAGVKRNERRRMLNAAATLAKEPLLKRDGLIGGGCYVEYRTDDARLTIEVVKKAVEYGTFAVNYAKAEQLLKDDDGRAIGAIVRDRLSGRTFRIEARKIINAAGPWVDEVREMDGSKTGKTLRLTKGVHLVFDGERFPLRHACYFDAPDGRMVFVIPREGKTYIGTTDTDYTGDTARPAAEREDRAYLLRAAAYMFPSLRLAEEDVESAWAGLRPLIHQEGKSPSEISRRDELFISPSGLISIAGGKLTGYRKMAEDVVDTAVKQLKADDRDIEFRSSFTKDILVSGGDVGGSERFEAFVAEKTAEGVTLGLDANTAAGLARGYGSNADRLYAWRDEAEQLVHKHGLPMEVAIRLLYAVREEMAVKPSDFFVRRTGDLIFRIGHVRRWKGAVIGAMSQELGWSAEEVRNYTEELEELLDEAAE